MKLKFRKTLLVASGIGLVLLFLVYFPTSAKAMEKRINQSGSYQPLGHPYDRYHHSFSHNPYRARNYN